jgi:hypothetical protein
LKAARARAPTDENSIREPRRAVVNLFKGMDQKALKLFFNSLIWLHHFLAQFILDQAFLFLVHCSSQRLFREAFLASGSGFPASCFEQNGC